MQENAPGQRTPPQANEYPPLDYNEYRPTPDSRILPRDTRSCGCTVHVYHKNCFGDCRRTYCGYRSDAPDNDVQALPNDGRVYVAAMIRLELNDWWRELAQTEADQVIAKAVEYGSRDLVDIGRDLADCMHREVSDQQAAELGVYFYLRGKMSRWTDAVRRGEQPSDDTLKDIGVYVRMAQRIRTHGGWPGKAES